MEENRTTSSQQLSYFDMNSTLFNPSDISRYTPYWERLETYVVPSLFLIIFILGVLGNGTLILIFLRHRNMRNAPNIYIFSLALGDLLVLVSCVPFISIIYTFESWPWGEEICKLSEATKDVSIGVSVFTLTALSVERYYAVVRPMSRLLVTRAWAVLTSSAIWLMSFALAIPAMVFSHCQTTFISENKATITFCTPFINRHHGKIMVSLQFFVYYFVPIVIIGFFYSMTAWHLVLSTRNLPGEHGKVQNRQILARKRVAIMVLAFVVIFVVCFLPHRAFTLWFYFNTNSEDEYNIFWHVLRITGFCLAFLNSCVNPVALYLISKAFRKYFNYYLVCSPPEELDGLRFITLRYNHSCLSRRQNFIVMASY